MKKRYFKVFFLALCLGIFSLTALPGCSRKTGCPADDAQVKVDKHGNPKSGKTKSGLFPKKMRK